MVINPGSSSSAASTNTNINASNTTNANGINKTKPKWIKAGIELTVGKPHLSVVAKDRWVDWSLA